MCDHLQKATTYPKHQNFSSLSLIVGISSKRPRPLFRKADLEFSIVLNLFQATLWYTGLAWSLCLLYRLRYSEFKKDC